MCSIDPSQNKCSTAFLLKAMSGEYRKVKMTQDGPSDATYVIYSFAVLTLLVVRILMMPYMLDRCQTAILKLAYTLPTCLILSNQMMLWIRRRVYEVRQFTWSTSA